MQRCVRSGYVAFALLGISRRPFCRGRDIWYAARKMTSCRAFASRKRAVDFAFSRIPIPQRPVLYYRDPTRRFRHGPQRLAEGCSGSRLPARVRRRRAVVRSAQNSRRPLPFRGVQAAKQDPLLPQSRWGFPTLRRCPRRTPMGMDYIPGLRRRRLPTTAPASRSRWDASNVPAYGPKPVEARVLVQPVHAVGTVAVDERQADDRHACAPKAFIEDLFVNTTGQLVQARASLCFGSIRRRFSRPRPISWWPSAPDSVASSAGRYRQKP